MDKRQQKTRRAIFTAFSLLLEQKRFSQITVQEIIDQANIGRSTFYAHFETKEDLLCQLCADMFRHVFSERLDTEKTHDFSASPNALEARITHILYHLKDNQAEIIRLLSGESRDLFLNYFKANLTEMFRGLVAHSGLDIPASYLESYLAGSFSDTVQWWAAQKMEAPPEAVAGYFLTVMKKGVIDCGGGSGT